VVAQEIEFQATEEQFGNVDEKTPALFFCKDLLGYGWCFRKGKHLNIGLGRTDSDRLSAHVAEFRQFLADRKIASCDESRHWPGHAYQLYDHAAPNLVDDRVVLVGDAAGLAYAQSGEGIRPAIESSLIAAGVILSSAGKYGRDDLAPYPTRLAARMGKPPSGNLLGWLPAAWLQSLASQLLMKKWFSRHVVMDQWFLRRKDKALLP
jgi:flavin-dependent dehydrogenase